MSVSQNYGVLRVVSIGTDERENKHRLKSALSSLAEDRSIFLITRSETTIGRALSNDFILLDSAVSRNHARLLLDEHGWHIENITEQNTIKINDRSIPNGTSAALKPLDLLTIGKSVLQLVAPASDLSEEGEHEPTNIEQSTGMQEQGAASILVRQEAHIVQALQRRTRQSIQEAAKLWYQRAGLNGHMSGSVPEEAVLPEYKPESQNGNETKMLYAMPASLKKRKYGLITGGIVFVFLLAAATAFLSNSIAGIPVIWQDGPANIFLILVLPLVPAIGIHFLVSFMDRFEKEPLFLRLAAFAWGAIVAIPPTFILEQYIFDRRTFMLGPQPTKALQALFSGFNAGLIEETAKGVGLVLLFLLLRDEFDNVTDGIVYGALIGAGFAMGENFLYFAENPRSVVFLIVGRIVLNWLCHSTFIVCFGIALGYVRHTNTRWKRIGIPIAGLLVAIALHTIFDFTSFFTNSLVVTYPTNPNIAIFAWIASVSNYIPPFIAQMIILYCLIRSLANECVLIREYLSGEVYNGVVTVDEYALLQHSFLRTKVERAVLYRYGFKQWWRVKKLYQIEIGLAFRKWHVAMGDPVKSGELQPEDLYRQQIVQLRHEIFQAER